MKNVSILFCFFAIIILSSCSQSEKDYYYQLEDLTETKVFHFHCDTDEQLTGYWVMSSNLETQELTTVAYDANFKEAYTLVEHFDDEGAKLLSFDSDLYYEDEFLEHTVRTVHESDVYHWSYSEPYSYRVTVPEGSLNDTHLKKTRTLIGEETLTIMGEEMDVLKYEDTFVSTSVSMGDDYEFTQTSYYGFGVGCVRMDMSYGFEKHSAVLAEILTLDEWEELLAGE